MLSIKTQRFTLVAATAELARADVEDRNRFQVLLGANQIPASWPIAVMQDAQEPLAKALEEGNAEPGWSMWYILERGALRGVAGCYGKPDDHGLVTIGYGVVPDVESQGVATEALAGLMRWAACEGHVKGFRATTFEHHTASLRVLEKNGFHFTGFSPDDAEVPDSDRQGRGRLVIWETARIAEPA